MTEISIASFKMVGFVTLTDSEREPPQIRFHFHANNSFSLSLSDPGYLGCYSHSRSNPSLDDGMFTNSNMTIQTCLTICRHRGYPYAGLAFGQECYCEAHEVDVSKKLENEECYLPCVGNRQQICGGGTAAGIYDSKL